MTTHSTGAACRTAARWHIGGAALLFLLSSVARGEPLDGYTLLCPLHSQPTLVDMDGNVVHVWTHAAIAGELRPDGSLIGPTGLRVGYTMGREFDGIVEESWQGEVTWRFDGREVDRDGQRTARVHHDLESQGMPVYFHPGTVNPSPGNLLFLVHRDTMAPQVSKRTIIDDVIIEVDRNGDPTAFEWAASDHIDDMNLTRQQRAGVARFPGYHLLMPRWFRRLKRIRNEWLHLNALSTLGDNAWFDSGDQRFHPDNIIVSSRHASFVSIISRDTGSIVWQLGPSATGDLGRLVGPHHAHMIPRGLPGAGNILLFDNGGFAGYGWLGMPRGRRPWSRVLEIDPRTNAVVWQYRRRRVLHRFFSNITGSVQRLPNGNTVINEGQDRRVFEVDPDGTVVWDLKWSDELYRAYRIPPDWVPGNPSDYADWEQGVPCR